MKKKILIASGTIIGACVLFAAFVIIVNRSQSPFKETTYSYQELDIKVTYCRPYKKGRLIFGTEIAEALQPYGQYWRLGANEATEITFNRDVLFAGMEVEAGSYRMYVVPNKGSWEVSLNTELGIWGAFEPDYALDIVKVDIPTTKTTPPWEQFTIEFEEDASGVQMNFAWDQIMVTVPISR